MPGRAVRLYSRSLTHAVALSSGGVPASEAAPPVRRGRGAGREVRVPRGHGSPQGPRTVHVQERVSHATRPGSCAVEGTPIIRVVPEQSKRTALEFLKKHFLVVLQLTSFSSWREATTQIRPTGQDSHQRRSHSVQVCCVHSTITLKATSPAWASTRKPPPSTLPSVAFRQIARSPRGPFSREWLPGGHRWAARRDAQSS